MGLRLMLPSDVLRGSVNVDVNSFSPSLAAGVPVRTVPTDCTQAHVIRGSSPLEAVYGIGASSASASVVSRSAKDCRAP